MPLNSPETAETAETAESTESTGSRPRVSSTVAWDWPFGRTDAEDRRSALTSVIGRLVLDSATDVSAGERQVADLAKVADIVQLAAPHNPLEDLLRLARRAAAAAPLVLTAGWHEVNLYGAGRFAQSARTAGIRGVHLLGLNATSAAAGCWLTHARDAGISTVFTAGKGPGAAGAAAYSTAWVHFDVAAADLHNLQATARSLRRIAGRPVCAGITEPGPGECGDHVPALAAAVAATGTVDGVVVTVRPGPEAPSGTGGSAAEPRVCREPARESHASSTKL
ncbi:hypothetical protein DVA86_21695 [Streptomyces armeniacus]|uniref:Uncharacterized protein n=2 Tax=Streptomyces armeniacus TaxID=83291 RepID=A0A345XTA4_9ACTN|nr:hypothetical protein DVA86_21695 [Streptomyces armeniacus]